MTDKREMADKIKKMLDDNGFRYSVWIRPAGDIDPYIMFTANLEELFTYFHVVLKRMGLRQKDALSLLARAYKGKSLRDISISLEKQNKPG